MNQYKKIMVPHVKILSCPIPLNEKQEEQMLEQSIFIIPTRTFSHHFHYLIHYCECTGNFMPLYNGLIAEVPAFLQNNDLNEGQDHSNWYQNEKHSHVYHHANFERNRFLNIQTLANLTHILYKLKVEFSPLNIKCATKFSMSLNKLKVMEAYQISSKLKTSAKVSVFSYRYEPE